MSHGGHKMICVVSYDKQNILRYFIPPKALDPHLA